MQSMNPVTVGHSKVSSKVYEPIASQESPHPINTNLKILDEEGYQREKMGL